MGLSWGRAAAGPAVAALWSAPHPPWRVLGTVLFLMAAASDALDGWLARSGRSTTAWGAYLDPVADKILVLGGALALVSAGRFGLWQLYPWLVRELAVTGLRALRPQGQLLAASRWAKVKMAAQVAALAAAALWPGRWSEGLWAVATALTLFSGAQYLWTGRGLAAAGEAGND